MSLSPDKSKNFCVSGDSEVMPLFVSRQELFLEYGGRGTVTISHS